MRVQQLLEHHGIIANPFADEDAQTDLVFKGSCIRTTYHPGWDKIYGEPSEPATAIVFGEKGSGKTALGLQIVRHLTDHNTSHPDQQAFVVPYNDFNPFLDRLRERMSGRRRRIERTLAEWRLWDHMDAILSLAVTQLVDRILQDKQARHPAAIDTPLPLARLDAAQVRDVMLLAACYDQSTAVSLPQRWQQLKRKLRFRTWRSSLDILVGVAVTAAVLAAIAYFGKWSWLQTVWPYLAVAAGWLPRVGRWLKWSWIGRKIGRHTRVLNHTTGMLRRVFMQFPGKTLAGQPLPVYQRTDDRYELLAKLQNVLRTLGLPAIVVLVDRLDEPYLVNGSPDLMRALLWPMLDNKFLKHPGLGLKLLLPAELIRFIDRETRDFYEKARLDKQNLIRSLDWSGQALCDVADARIRACAAEGASPTIRALFDSGLESRRLQEAFAQLRVPRHLFKFMYRVLSAHCNAHTELEPVWTISPATFESVLAVYLRDQDAAERGMGAV
jgi:hypothetical protein